jgi:hypothetical protein
MRGGDMIEKECGNGKGDMPDAQELREIFEVLTEHVPRLLEAVTKVLYNAQEGEKFGQSVAGFYRSLKTAGMSGEEAFELTKQYMDTLSLGGLLKNIIGSHTGEDDMGRAIKRRMAKETEEDG